MLNIIKNQLAISNIAWDKNDEFDVFNLLYKLNIINIELAPTKIFNNIYNCTDNDIFEYSKKLSSYTLIPRVFQSILYGENNLQVFDYNTYEQFFKRLDRIAYIANKMRVKVLVFGAPKNRIRNNKEYNIAINFFREVNDIVKQYNCIIGVEANPPIYNCDFLNTTSEVIQFIKDVNRENIQLHIDTGAILINKEDLDILKNNDIQICHVHLSEEYLKSISHDIYFYEKLFILLSEKNYNNFISIEMKKQNNVLQSIQSSIEHILKGITLCQQKNNMIY